VKNSSNRRAGPWLVLLCLAATAGTLYWVWRRIEPDVRYRRICSALRLHRMNQGGSQDGSLGNRFWSNLAWFSDHARNGFLDRLFQSLASKDPEEREDAAILAANLDQREEDRTISVRGIPYFPAATETPLSLIRFRIHSALKEHPDALRHMAADERRLVRACFLDLIWWDRRDRFKKEVAEIALRDPDIDLRLQAIPMLLHGVLFPDEATLLQLTQDANLQVRLRATCLLAMEGRKLQALQDWILLLSDPDVPLEANERMAAIEAIPEMYAPLSGRCEKTRKAIQTSPEALRAVGADWKTWFRSKDYEEFVVELSKGR
jgi:hypothetical protein